MCAFISWIEDGKEIYFLTCNDLNTKEGRKLVKELKEINRFMMTFLDTVQYVNISI